MNPLLSLRHASNVPSSWPVKRPLPKRGVAIQRKVVPRLLSPKLLLLRSRNNAFACEMAEAEVCLLRLAALRERLPGKRKSFRQGRQGAQPREEPGVAPLRLAEDAAATIHRAPEHNCFRNVAGEVCAVP